MKVAFLSINSKYIHTLLAPRYLIANTHFPVHLLETNINVSYYDTLSRIHSLCPDVLAISTYIFNIDYVRKLLPEIKKLLPKTILILGGYEVSYDVEKYLTKCDYILRGEGDFAFNELLISLDQGKSMPQILDAPIICDLNTIASPYSKEYCELGKEKILYFESSRGCPFSCSYCMSSLDKKVRTFSLERTFAELKHIVSFGVKQIKFVDRTFNFDMGRANKIFQFIISSFNECATNFHFEMAPELFNEETFEILSKAKKGLIQFEIGVQSFNSNTLKAVGRFADEQKMFDHLRRILALKNIHLHVDLIAGLPFEGLESFMTGFNKLYELRADCLQLGFLKVLKGAPLSENVQDYVTTEGAPYEILYTKWLSFEDIKVLKKVERTLETFSNSNRFKSTLLYLIPKFFTAFDFFYGLSIYLDNQLKENEQLSAFHQCEMVYHFVTAQKSEVDKKELILKINDDYAAGGNARKWRRNALI